MGAYEDILDSLIDKIGFEKKMNSITQCGRAYSKDGVYIPISEVEKGDKDMREITESELKTALSYSLVYTKADYHRKEAHIDTFLWYLFDNGFKIVRVE